MLKKLCFPYLRYLLLCGPLLLGGCHRYYLIERESHPRPMLSRINIIDREGCVTTIDAPDRLKYYQNTNFLAPQAYEKIMGIYERQKDGTIRSFITSYHPNGQIRQWLDVLNGRAHGIYREWHDNGTLRIEAHVMGGEADLTESAMRSWLFEEESQAWNAQGKLEAQFHYHKGKLEGEAIEYHATGGVKRRIHYHDHILDGPEEIYDEKGTLRERTLYASGFRQGITTRYWPSGILMAEEHFEKECLYSGKYYNKNQECICVIEAGSGSRVIFDDERMRTREQYQNGLPQGLVEVFDANGSLMQTYHQRQGKRNGEEILFYAPTSLQEYLSGELRPKISLMWADDRLQGLVKTWYEDGQLESQREMNQNARNGLSGAWYRNGHLMLMEEYEQDKLIKGEYYRRNERLPISIVHEGTGEATLYDGDGTLVRKIEYFRSRPLSE